MNPASDTKHYKLTANVKAGGCAAKVSALELAQILQGVRNQTQLTNCPQLIAGIENFEDAAVYKLSEDMALVKTLDFFPPMIDDPYLFGQIAATNALSDVYAMGGRPILALNILSFPSCTYPPETVGAILEGGAAAIQAAGAVLAGGHTIQSPELLYGLSVAGLVHPQKMLTNSGARAEDAIVITKAIGTGICLLGMKADLLKAENKSALITSLTQSNKLGEPWSTGFINL